MVFPEIIIWCSKYIEETKSVQNTREGVHLIVKLQGVDL